MMLEVILPQGPAVEQVAVNNIFCQSTPSTQLR